MSDYLKLRDYQIECRNAVESAWSGGMQRPAVVLPTGSGKTVVFADLTRRFLNFPGGRVVVLVHRDELADQAIAKLRAAMPDVLIGKVKAGSDEIHCPVMVCSVQTLARASRRDRLVDGQIRFGPIGLVIVDEAHHAAADSYRRIMSALGCFETDGTPAVGFTATLARGDGVGLGSVWEDVVFTRSVLWMISRGYLTDVRGKEVSLADLDLSQVARTAGDYQAAALGRAMIDSGSPEVVAHAVREHAADRRSIVFTPDVASAHATAEALGTDAVITGATPREERLGHYAAFREGRTGVMVNCMVLTEGADFPECDCAVIARPTANPSLYIQMVGRALRPYPGKTDALIINIGGVGGTISTLIDLAPGEVRTVRSDESLADAAIRTEEEANEIVPAGSLAFALRHRDLDLFAGSSHAWLRTPAGVMFIPVGNGFVFLWASGDGNWDVCLAPPRGKWKRLHTGLPLGSAMAWAETEAEDVMPFNGTRKAGWRKTRAEAGQINMARSLGIEIPEDPRKGILSDGVSTALASRKFDLHMRRVPV